MGPGYKASLKAYPTDIAPSPKLLLHIPHPSQTAPASWGQSVQTQEPNEGYFPSKPQQETSNSVFLLDK